MNSGIGKKAQKKFNSVLDKIFGKKNQEGIEKANKQISYLEKNIDELGKEKKIVAERAKNPNYLKNHKIGVDDIMERNLDLEDEISRKKNALESLNKKVNKLTEEQRKSNRAKNALNTIVELGLAKEMVNPSESIKDKREAARSGMFIMDFLEPVKKSL